MALGVLCPKRGVQMQTFLLVGLRNSRLVIVFFAFVLGLLLVPRPASASPTGLTLTLDTKGGPIFTVIGGESITLDFTLTNHSGRDLSLNEVEISLGPIIVGDDDSIDLTHFSFGFLTPLSTLSSGSSNNFSMTLPTDAPTEPDFLDFDSSLQSLSLSFDYCPASEPQCSSADELSAEVGFAVIVQDANNSATPEPSTLLLLGSGVLGLVPFCRRFAH